LSEGIEVLPKLDDLSMQGEYQDQDFAEHAPEKGANGDSKQKSHKGANAE
jgi:hypothetical protein